MSCYTEDCGRYRVEYGYEADYGGLFIDVYDLQAERPTLPVVSRDCFIRSKWLTKAEAIRIGRRYGARKIASVLRKL